MYKLDLFGKEKRRVADMDIGIVARVRENTDYIDELPDYKIPKLREVLEKQRKHDMGLKGHHRRTDDEEWHHRDRKPLHCTEVLTPRQIARRARNNRYRSKRVTIVDTVRLFVEA